MAFTTEAELSATKMERGNTSFDQGEAHVIANRDFSVISPGGHSEEDIYEDAGDLDFTCSAQAVYLTRIPKFLWKTWSHLRDDQEINLGTVRVEGGLQKPSRISLLLSRDDAVNTTIPKEYNMQVTNSGSMNTFMFTEKDLPGYNNRMRNGTKQIQQTGSMPFAQVAPRPQFQDRSRMVSAKVDKKKKKKWQSQYRKGIPKKTAMVGFVYKEINCLPVENEEYRQVMDERTRQSMKPKRETKLMSGPVAAHAGNLLAPGTLGTPGNFETFIKTTGSQRGKPQEFKAARIPENELIDRISVCFQRYTYWSLRALKAEIKQPEQYIKDILGRVGQLVRQGTHAMTWKLNPDVMVREYARGQSYELAQNEAAPDSGYNLEGVSDTGENLGTEDDTEDIKFEDVDLL